MAKPKGLESLLPASEPRYAATENRATDFMKRSPAENIDQLRILLHDLYQMSKDRDDDIILAWASNLSRTLALSICEQTGREEYRLLAEQLEEYERGLNESRPVDNSFLCRFKPDGQESTDEEGDVIRERMRGISFTMDAMKDPGEACINYGLPVGYYARFETRRMDELARKAAASLGCDPEEIINKDTRTPEQQEELLRQYASDQLKRFDAFRQSLYMRLLLLLEECRLPDEVELTDENGNPFLLREQAVLYFFATHFEYESSSLAPVSDGMLEEIKAIYANMNRFFRENLSSGVGASELLLSFIEQEVPSRALVESIISQFPLIQSMTPRSHTIPNNPLMNALQQKDIIGIGPIDLVVANERGKKKEITSYTIAAFDTGESDIKITDTKLTEYERQVSDAIVSLWEEARKQKLDPVFTADAIYRAMPGGSDKASPQQKGAITKSIEKFRRLHITINATDEMRKRRLIGETDSVKFDDFYLSATRAEYKIKNGGQTVIAYRINTEPIILTYCKMTKQLLTVPAKYLTIRKVSMGVPGESISMTSTRQAMTGYMIRRIKIMQRDLAQATVRKRTYDARRIREPSLAELPKEAFRETSDVISFDALFSDVGLSEQDRTEIKRNRDFCIDVLEYQKNVGFFRDYELVTKGRSITGVRIIH